MNCCADKTRSAGTKAKQHWLSSVMEKRLSRKIISDSLAPSAAMWSGVVPRKLCAVAAAWSIVFWAGWSDAVGDTRRWIWRRTLAVTGRVCEWPAKSCRKCADAFQLATRHCNSQRAILYSYWVVDWAIRKKYRLVIAKRYCRRRSRGNTVILQSPNDIFCVLLSPLPNNCFIMYPACVLDSTKVQLFTTSEWAQELFDS